eukprot:3291032-Pyramimonas_sp.AAC.1
MGVQASETPRTPNQNRMIPPSKDRSRIPSGCIELGLAAKHVPFSDPLAGPCASRVLGKARVYARCSRPGIRLACTWCRLDRKDCRKPSASCVL